MSCVSPRSKFRVAIMTVPLCECVSAACYCGATSPIRDAKICVLLHWSPSEDRHWVEPRGFFMKIFASCFLISCGVLRWVPANRKAWEAECDAVSDSVARTLSVKSCGPRSDCYELYLRRYCLSRTSHVARVLPGTRR